MGYSRFIFNPPRTSTITRPDFKVFVAHGIWLEESDDQDGAIRVFWVDCCWSTSGPCCLLVCFRTWRSRGRCARPGPAGLIALPSYELKYSCALPFLSPTALPPTARPLLLIPWEWSTGAMLIMGLGFPPPLFRRSLQPQSSRCLDTGDTSNVRLDGVRSKLSSSLLISPVDL